MGRSRQRACLQDGLKLDLNNMARRGFVRPGALTGPIGINWTHGYWGRVASGLLWADMTGDWEGSFRVQLGDLDQRIMLIARPRNFGGHQWYFMCPQMNRRASVLWRPPGATRFGSRQVWPRRVAYASQYRSPTDRAWAGKSRIKAKLIADQDPDAWDVPPKPKGMRWATYNRYVEQDDHYEDLLDREIAWATSMLLARWKDV